MIQTKKCIRCGKEAKFWTGYVQKRNGERVLAGWCSEYCMNKCIGFYGSFKKKYGEESVE